MPNPLIRLAIVSTLTLGSSVALAVPFNSFDPRSMAMGGAGVAMGDAAMAPFFNPALLAVTRDEDDFAMNLPIAGARIYDPEDFQDSLDAFQEGNYIDNLNMSIDTFNTTQSSTDLRIVADNTSTLSTEFSTLDSKPIQGEGGAAVVIGIPGKTVGGAFYANVWGALGGVVNYRDDATLQDFAATLTAVADCYDMGMGCTPDTVSNYSTYFNPDGSVKFTTNDLQSSVDMQIALFGESGLALATQFGDGDGSWALGVTPKYVKVMLYEYSADVNSADSGDSTDSDYLAEYAHVNFDIGLAKNFNNGWRTGVVVKNILSHTYDFKNAPTPGAEPVPTGNTITLKPQARMGVSHQNSWSTVALDVDLTTNDPAGFEEKSRYIALGGELNGWDWIMLRAGYRMNTLDSDRNVASVGLGLALFGTLHIDASVASNADEMGAAVQLGLQF